VRVGDPLLPPSDFTTNDFFGEFRYDTLDNVNFPRRGASLQIGWKGERGVGGSQDANLLEFDQLYAHSWGRNTAILWTSAGTQLDEDVDVVRSYFTLGGFFNLSAVTPETLAGPHYAIARGIYYRQVGRGGQGFLNVPVFVGTSIELGNVWKSWNDVSASSAKTNGSAFLGLDTLLGPVYFATGFDDKGESNVYLFLGRTF
jgi:NTE family protein